MSFIISKTISWSETKKQLFFINGEVKLLRKYKFICIYILKCWVKMNTIWKEDEFSIYYT